jgi:hypothetical protein
MESNDIFIKTAQGKAEIESNDRALSMQERRLLILVNGEKDVTTLGKLSRCENYDEILTSLEEGKLIERLEVKSPPRKTNGAAAPADDEKGVSARDFLCNVLITFGNRVRVGKLIDEIRSVEDIESLKSKITPWYQALAETPGGMYEADKLRDQAQSLIDAEALTGLR